MKIACLGTLFAVALSAQAAQAEESDPLHLAFRAGAGCPGRAEFIAQVRARTERVRFVDELPGPPELTVGASAEGPNAVGWVRLGKSNADRRVTGRTCGEVISALALIAALALDPDAWPGNPTDAPGDNLTSMTPPPEGRSIRDTPRETGIAVTGTDPRPGHPFFAGTGLQAEVFRGFGADAITMAGASVHAEAGLELGPPWRPLLRVAAVLGHSGAVVPDTEPDTGAATFALRAGRLELCPLEFEPRRSFLVRPCAGIEVGRLEGTGKPVDNGRITSLRSDQILWLAARQTVQARIRLAARVWLELEMGASEPLIRRRFVFSNPDVTVTSVPAVEIIGALGLGIHFP